MKQQSGDVTDAIRMSGEAASTHPTRTGGRHGEARRSWESRFFDLWAFLAAFVIAIMIAGGDYIRRDLGEADSSVISWRYWLGGVGLVAVFTVACGVLLSLLYSAMDTAKPDRGAVAGPSEEGRLRGQGVESDDGGTARRGKRIPVAVKRYAIIVACWLPYLLVRFPGNVDTDCQSQLVQFYGYAARVDHHPWFDTLVFGAFWKIGDALGSNAWSVFLYAVVMIAITAAAFAVMIEWMRRACIPVVFQRIALWFCALYPLIPLSVVTVSKETMYGPWFVLFVTMAADIVRTKGSCLGSWKFDVALGLAMALMMLTKKTGLMVVLLTCIIVFFAVRGRKGLRLLAIVAVVAALFLGLWQHAALPAMGVEKGEDREKMSVPAQITGAYVRNHASEMTDDDWQVLDGVFTDAKTIGERYEPWHSNAIKDTWRPDSTSTQRRAYYHWLMKAVAHDPGLAIEAALSTGLATYYPDTTRQGNESYLWYRDYMCPQGKTYDQLHGQPDEFGFGNDCAATPEIWDVMHTTAKPQWAAAVSSAYNRVYLTVAKHVPLPFLKALYASWIPVICLGYCIRRRSAAGAMALVPAFVTLATLLASPLIHVRYVLPSVYATPMNLAAGYLEPESDENPEPEEESRGPEE
ncbi:MAG: DUF6020 family protein [Bifidobacteriaceae bacterium]|nr:DUF6020 family protein [Bifidobacteriaceae bacterium]